METIKFLNLDSNEEAVAIVRAVHGGIGLAISLREGGDVEVFMNKEIAEKLLSAIGNELN